MRESTYTTKLLAVLRTHPLLRDSAWIQKHNDRSSRGVPDFSVTVGMRTLWVECKMEGEKPTKIQQWTLNRIGDGAMTIWFGHGGCCYAWRAAKLTDWIPLDAMATVIAELVTNATL